MKSIQLNTSQLRVLASFKGNTWLMMQTAMQEHAMSALEVADKVDPQKEANYYEKFYNLRSPLSIVDKIAHIDVKGSLLHKIPAIYEDLGLATRYSTIESETREAVQKGAKGIIYHFDTPGGTVAGVVEGGAAIQNAGVPTVAFCSGLTCSAGYWLASGTNAIVATPSATIGNIGAIISWADCDAFWADIGITFKALVSEGADLKSTFHLEPNEDQLAFLQESINDAGAAFRAHVAAGRKAAGAELDPEVWRAGWYSGTKAGNLGLLDEIGGIETAVEVLREMM